MCDCRDNQLPTCPVTPAWIQVISSLFFAGNHDGSSGQVLPGLAGGGKSRTQNSRPSSSLDRFLDNSSASGECYIAKDVTSCWKHGSGRQSGACRLTSGNWSSEIIPIFDTWPNGSTTVIGRCLDISTVSLIIDRIDVVYGKWTVTCLSRI